MTIRLRRWREEWQDLTDPPDASDHERESSFLRDHVLYGAAIHRDTANALAAALEAEPGETQRLTLFLRLFAEYVSSLESLGAFGWAMRWRSDFRMFLDGFLSYEQDGPRSFYRRVLDAEEGLIELLGLPPRAPVIAAVRALHPDGGTAREAGEYLDTGIQNVRQAAEQYFVEDSVLLTHYNKAKHGATMVRLADHPHGARDFQVIAPNRDEEAVAAGAWYDIARFTASDHQIERIRRNIAAVTGSIQQLAVIALALYSQEIFYTDPEAF